MIPVIPQETVRVFFDDTWAASQEVTLTCLHCPGWTATVAMGDRERVFEKHRERHAPELNRARKRVVCGRHSCHKRTEHKTGLCPDHRLDMERNMAGRGGRLGKILVVRKR